MFTDTVEPLNNERIGTANFFIIWRFSFLRGIYKSIEKYANGTLEYFIMRGFSLWGEFIIGGSTVFKLQAKN